VVAAASLLLRTQSLDLALSVAHTAVVAAAVVQGKTTPVTAVAVAQAAQVRAASPSSSPTSNLTNSKK
jgi:hypothetical protein